ncbi:tetratricopeptide repeat protein [Actinomadura alba]|uniref:Tetratricopeptide repeat protein n=1 Tax=Actinomadura alba TaxID=406431 RepID=A0ABR7LY10_9ACTN|nr:tetratricopeptide repeat protein [Actinomadura alba]MBC6469747.1 tetratricopeptide repeat protein [Actinomadura alba]
MSATSDEATADPSLRCEEARRFAESGDLERAARLFEEVLELGDVPQRALAALGLAVVLEDFGDVEGAREADWAAIETRDAEYGPRAAYHLALSHERAGERGPAGEAWGVVADFGNPAYLPPAFLALARLADDEGDVSSACEWWERAIGTGDEEYAPVAAHDLAHRLLEQGESARAQRVLADALRLVDRAAAPYAYARLAAAIGIAHLDQAIGAFGAVLEAGDGDAEVAALATELLARTLPLRGRGDESAEVWRRGLTDPVLAEQVRARLRRDLPAGDEAGDGAGDGAEAGEPWWEPHVESALRANTLPSLTGEVFGALDDMYALIALRYAEGVADLPVETRELLGRAVRVPSEYAWGRGLHDSFAERLRAAMGSRAPVLPPRWPDPPGG